MGISKEALEARLETAKRIYADGRISKDLYEGLTKATIELYLDGKKNEEVK